MIRKYFRKKQTSLSATKVLCTLESTKVLRKQLASQLELDQSQIRLLITFFQHCPSSPLSYIHFTSIQDHSPYCPFSQLHRDITLSAYILPTTYTLVQHIACHIYHTPTRYFCCSRPDHSRYLHRLWMPAILPQTTTTHSIIAEPPYSHLCRFTKAIRSSEHQTFTRAFFHKIFPIE